MLIPTLIQQATSDTTKVLLINEGQSWLQTWLPIIPAVVAIIAMILTLLFSLNAIKKTAEASRVSNIHFEMYKCLYETCKQLSQLIMYLYYVANGTVIALEGEVVESYYEKYIKEIDGLSDEYNAAVVKQELLLPDKLLSKLHPLMNKIEEAQRIATQKVMNPRNHKSNFEAERYEENKRELKPKVKEIMLCYENFRNHARHYIGPHKLKTIGNFSDLRMFSQKDN